MKEQSQSCQDSLEPLSGPGNHGSFHILTEEPDPIRQHKPFSNSALQVHKLLHVYEGGCHTSIHTLIRINCFRPNNNIFESYSKNSPRKLPNWRAIGSDINPGGRS